MQRAQVGEPGELVGHRLALDRLVQAAFSIETTAWPARYCEQLLLLARERRPRRAIESTPRYSGDVPGGASTDRSACTVPTCGAWPSRGRAPARALRSGCEQLPAGVGRGPNARRSAASRASATSLAPTLRSSKAPVDGQGAAGLGLAGVDRRAHGELDHAVAVEAHGERVARRGGSSPPARRAGARPPRSSASSCSDMLLNSSAELGELVVALTGTGCGSRRGRAGGRRRGTSSIWPVRARLTTAAATTASEQERRRSAAIRRRLLRSSSRSAAGRGGARSTAEPAGSPRRVDAPAVVGAAAGEVACARRAGMRGRRPGRSRPAAAAGGRRDVEPVSRERAGRTGRLGERHDRPNRCCRACSSRRRLGGDRPRRAGPRERRPARRPQRDRDGDRRARRPVAPAAVAPPGDRREASAARSRGSRGDCAAAPARARRAPRDRSRRRSAAPRRDRRRPYRARCSAVSAKATSATATSGTSTISAKNTRKRPRKLIGRALPARLPAPRLLTPQEFTLCSAATMRAFRAPRGL